MTQPPYAVNDRRHDVPRIEIAGWPCRWQPCRMRVLLSTTANAGHYEPVLPFAGVCVVAGHEVRVAAPESYGTPLARVRLMHE